MNNKQSGQPLLDVHESVSYCVGSFGQGLDHPECVAWGCDGFAYAGGESGQIYRIDLVQSTFEQFATTPGFVGGICQDLDHNLYACVANGVYKITNTGKVSLYSGGAEGNEMLAPNYPVFDAHGNLYVSDAGIWGESNGKIFRVTPEGYTDVWSEYPKTFPNGLCLSPEGEYLYVAVSLDQPRIERISINDDGTSGSREIVTLVPRSVPDGLAFDDEGTLYISCYRPDRIWRYRQDKGLEVLVDDYEGTLMASPTNIAFCGSDRSDLLSANLGRWHISRYDLSGIGSPRGAPLNYPKILSVED